MRAELVATLKRKATNLLADVVRDKQPILITQHGLPGAYLVDVETWQLQRERTAILEGIARGEVTSGEGRMLRQLQVEMRLAPWCDSITKLADSARGNLLAYDAA
jgi:prevent-host-death family protein